MAENIPAEMEATNEPELTMCDVLEEEKELEADAKAVLGDSDDTNCTFDLGYVPRQALYACKTCSVGGQPGGICLACSYACHENHELVELYTKRHFRCDCGNKAFPNNACRLRPKNETNEENSYNQNFSGVYCICSRPYPDATDNVQDEMIQCVMCEDWYHGRHLADDIPDSEDYGEMICGKCMDLNEFLYAYKSHFEIESIISVDDAKDIKTEGIKMEAPEEGAKKEEHELMSVVDAKPATQASVKEEQKICLLQDMISDGLKRVLGPAFLPDGWRDKLCRCPACHRLYEEKKCMFLLDENDTIKAYEERGKSRNGEESQYDKGLNALSKLDRVKQMEAIREYDSMKTELKDYLKTFADAKRTVCAKDIQDFFDGMHQRKRQRLDNHVPHYCH